MTPQPSFPRRRWICRLLQLSALAATLASGCTAPLFFASRSDSGAELPDVSDELDQGVRLVKDYTTAWGTNYVKLEGVALVTGLNRTGSDPPPSLQRDALIAEMQTHEVKNPNFVLASGDTSLVLLRAFLPPGVRKGDRVDVEVRVPGRSETTSLRGGWLMKARLREVAILENTLRTGRVEAEAEGPVTIDAAFDNTDDEIRQVRGRVLGGGVAFSSRPLGLLVATENHSIKTSTMIGAAINARFHTFDRGIKKGVATPKRDSFVELEVHPRYQHNLGRYVRVVRSIAVDESAADRVARLEMLGKMLHEPTTAAVAALQLEAIGKEAIRVLQQGATAQDPEVRFYAAEALAYLDDQAAAEPLGQAAREEPAFRWHAIAALSAMDHVSAHDELSQLLHVSSAETRYAAFLGLRSRNPMDSLIRGQAPGNLFNLHLVDSTGPPLIHLSRSRRAEIVVFGGTGELQSPSFLYAGKEIMLKSDGPDRIKVLRFVPGQDDRQAVCSLRLPEVIKTVVEMGGGYADVMQLLQEAKDKGCLEHRIVVDALPMGGRIYRRGTGQEAPQDELEATDRPVASPLPGLFDNSPATSGREQDAEEKGVFDISPEEEPSPGWWRRMGGWFAGG